MRILLFLVASICVSSISGICHADVSSDLQSIVGHYTGSFQVTETLTDGSQLSGVNQVAGDLTFDGTRLSFNCNVGFGIGFIGFSELVYPSGGVSNGSSVLGTVTNFIDITQNQIVTFNSPNLAITIDLVYGGNHYQGTANLNK